MNKSVLAALLLFPLATFSSSVPAQECIDPVVTIITEPGGNTIIAIDGKAIGTASSFQVSTELGPLAAKVDPAPKPRPKDPIWDGPKPKPSPPKCHGPFCPDSKSFVDEIRNRFWTDVKTVEIIQVKEGAINRIQQAGLSPASE